MGTLQLKLELLSSDLTSCILDEACQLMLSPGIKVQSRQARLLLADAGAQVDTTAKVAKIPKKVVWAALQTAP